MTVILISNHVNMYIYYIYGVNKLSSYSLHARLWSDLALYNSGGSRVAKKTVSFLSQLWQSVRTTYSRLA